VAVDDYAYHGVNYRDDPNMVLPEGEGFNDELGKKDKFTLFLVFLDVFVILLYIGCFFVCNITNCFLYVYCAPVRPVGMSSLHR
jgi:hypothetical protein